MNGFCYQEPNILDWDLICKGSGSGGIWGVGVVWAILQSLDAGKWSEGIHGEEDDSKTSLD